MSFNWETFRERESNITRSWVDAADLSRLSRDAFLGELSPLRRDASSGRIRFMGEGVQGHSASLEAIASAMTAFQRLVTSSSMALEGNFSLRGKPPAAIAQKSKLNLEASPAPGSLMLYFAPAHPVEKEISPDGQAEFLHDEKMLVDNAIESSLRLLEGSKAVGVVGSEDDFAEKLNDVGPRVTSALRNFAKTLYESQLETEVIWEIPRKPRIQSHLKVSQLHRLVQIVTATEKDTEVVEFTGTFRTLSDVEYLRLDTANGQVLSLNAKEIPIETIQEFSVGDQATVSVQVHEKAGAGLESTYKYTVLSMRKL